MFDGAQNAEMLADRWASDSIEKSALTRIGPCFVGRVAVSINYTQETALFTGDSAAHRIELLSDNTLGPLSLSRARLNEVVRCVNVCTLQGLWLNLLMLRNQTTNP